MNLLPNNGNARIWRAGKSTNLHELAEKIRAHVVPLLLFIALIQQIWHFLTDNISAYIKSCSSRLDFYKII